ncbi:hypothetical protein [Cognatishimia sp.]|uniref:hypothetical protein n=1 Tax=Cognatishimia sp. TaxID=2211648 RepID=UPI003512BA27
MSDVLHVDPGERGSLRIFTVDIEASARRKLLTPKSDMPPVGAALGGLLGVDWIDPDHADLFDIAELDDLGLRGFLSQGAGVSEADLDAHRAQLDALSGTVLIVYARGFSEAGHQLTPAPQVTPVLYLREDKEHIQFDPLPSAAAQGQLTPPPPVQKTPHLTVLLAILALPILALIVGAVVLGVLR